MFTDLNIPIPYRGGYYSDRLRGGILAESVGEVYESQEGGMNGHRSPVSQAWRSTTHNYE